MKPWKLSFAKETSFSRSRPQGFLSSRAPCFVSLKTLNGELRGCIGTIEPARDTLAQEIIANAISAATNDPRFEPVRPKELSNLRLFSRRAFPAEETVMVIWIRLCLV